MSDRHLNYRKAVWLLITKRLLNPPPKNSIMFVGSSIFRLWTTLESDMNPLPVYNQAFGGSTTWEVLHYADKLILPHNPKIIVYYCGSNDIKVGKDAAQISQSFQTFVEYIATHLPKTLVFFVSINLAPDKQEKWLIVDDANTLIQEYCDRSPSLEFIDVNPVLFNELGQPRLDLYLDDMVHFKPHGYQEFTKIIKPILQDAWKSVISK